MFRQFYINNFFFGWETCAFYMEGACVCMHTYVCMCVCVYACVKFYGNKQNNSAFSSVTVPPKLFWRLYSFCVMWVTFQLLYFVYGVLFT